MMNTNRDQLTRSLERLNTKYVDILFVHNPEYFLMTNVKGTEDNVKSKQSMLHHQTSVRTFIPSPRHEPTLTISSTLPPPDIEHQTILLNRLAILFEELEREIEKGRIRAYGISSNSFSLKPSHAHFLPYQDLVKMATSAFDRMRVQREQEHALFLEQQQQQQPSGGVIPGGRSGGKVFPPSNSNSFSTTATKTTPLSPSHKPGQGSTAEKRPSQPTPPKLVNRTTHGLGYLQMPGNLLETEGLHTTAKWAKTKNLSVFINRPLNAMSPEYGPARLASYPPPLAPTYAEAKDEILGALVTLGKQREYLQPKMGRLKEMIEGLDVSLRTDKLSIIQMEGASVRNQLHQELAKPVPVSSKTKGSGSGTISGNASPSLSPAAAAAVEAFKTSPTSTKPPTSPSTPTTPPHSTTHGTHGKVTEHELDHLIKSLDHFIHAFHQQVRFQETTRIRKIMTERGVNLKEEPIEQFAVEYLLEHDQVDAVLVGMKREPYVDFARGVLKSLVAPHPPTPPPPSS